MARIRGLLATLVILAVTIGVPFALLAFGSPLTELPSPQDLPRLLTSPDDGTLFMVFIQVAGWVAWAFLALSIVVELVAQLRGVRAPRLPGLQMPQSAARSLVASALLLFAAVPMASAASAPAAAQTMHVETVAVATTLADDAHEQDGADSAPTQDHQRAPKVVHTVAPGDNLWDIADRYLGDGQRYREIVAANPDLLAGTASDLSVGWTLRIPMVEQARDRDTKDTARDVVVRPGDTLSEIADSELGDSTRYPEIYQASRDVTQPGGAHLSDPDLILPGWTVKIPGAEAEAEDVGRGRGSSAPSIPTSRTVEAEESDKAAPRDTPPSTSATGDIARPDVTPDRADSTATPAPASSSTTGAAETAVPDAAAGESAADDGLDDALVWQAATVGGAGTILVAGALAVLARRRRDQQRLRHPGQTMPLPDAEAALFEQTIRAAADPMSRAVVDKALRALAAHCAQTGQVVPPVRAALLTETAFELYLEEPASLPAPWTGANADTIWSLHVQDIAALPAADSAVAPFPALVTIGRDENQAHVFLNLERLGALTVTGSDDQAREVMAALAVELATSQWADDLQVTVVGAFSELEEALGSGRVRYEPTIGRLADRIATRADQDVAALAAHGLSDLPTARIRQVGSEVWEPEIVLLAGPLTEQQQDELATLVAAYPRMTFAFVTQGIVLGPWNMAFHAGQDEAVLAPIGMPLTPQRLDSEAYQHLLEVMALAHADEVAGPKPPEPSVVQVDAIATAAVDEEPAEPVAVDEEPAEPMAEDATSFALAPTTYQSVDEGHDVDALAPESELDPASAPTAREREVAPVVLPLPPETISTGSAPRILVLGQVEMTGASGPVEPKKRGRLLELAAFLVLHPQVTAAAIDDAIWPDRRSDDNLNTRNTATSKLRRWTGQDADGQDYLPRQRAGGGYGFVRAVTTDVDTWKQLLGDNPMEASTGNLQAALKLVRGIPFEGTSRGRYAWAEPVRQRLISQIVDAAWTLAKRHLMDGRWAAAEEAAVVGLGVEPAQENLWRLRILAAHRRNPQAEAEAIDGLLTVTEQLECELEPETEHLLDTLKNPGADFERLMANAL